MKSIAKCTAVAVALIGAASLAQADVRVDEAVKLQQAGTIKPFDTLNEIAMKQHVGAKITDTELEDSYGKYIYQVELRDESGKEWDVEIDAVTGEVLRSEQDD